MLQLWVPRRRFFLLIQSQSSIGLRLGLARCLCEPTDSRVIFSTNSKNTDLLEYKISFYITPFLCWGRNLHDIKANCCSRPSGSPISALSIITTLSLWRGPCCWIIVVAWWQGKIIVYALRKERALRERRESAAIWKNSDGHLDLFFFRYFPQTSGKIQMEQSEDSRTGTDFSQSALAEVFHVTI